jgi:23S rRNA U2552 (ribose-2'-O)-methylase RlmE/FtsJ
LISGSATGVCVEHTTETAARFCIDVAKDLGSGKCKFYYEEDFNHLIKLYGAMKLLQTKGKK